MTGKVSDIEAALLARRVKQTADARRALTTDSRWPRLPAMIVTPTVIGVTGRSTDVAAYLGIGRELLFLLLALVSMVIFLVDDAVATRRRLNALVRLVDSSAQNER